MEFKHNFVEPFFLAWDHYVNPSCHNGNRALYFAIDDTHPLNAAMDELRIEDGHLPMFPDVRIEGEYDMDGWYTFYLIAEEIADKSYVMSIEAVVESEAAADNGCGYDIAIPNDAQEAVIKRLNELCGHYFGCSLDQMFEDYE